MNAKKQGNGLLVVLIIISALAFGVYSVFDLVNSEFRLNKRAELYNEAKQAAESLIQSGVADMHILLENASAIDQNIVAPTNNPLSVSDEFLAIYSSTDSNLVIPTVTEYTDPGQFFTQDTEIIGGRFTAGWQSRFIDSSVVGNEYDDQRDSNVFFKTAEVFAKASVENPLLGTITVYASQLVEVREISLFAYAIYYNVPLEIAPGPEMNVFGNVHVNGDAWLQANSSLNFRGNVTIAGDLFHGRHPDNFLSDAGGDVTFVNDNNDLLNLKKNDLWPANAKALFDGTWLQSIINGKRVENFGEVASQVWDGNLRTQDHEVKPVRLAGVEDYIEDTEDATPGKQSFNSAYNIIQPTLNEIEIPSKSADPEGYYRAIAARTAEKNKFSYTAGLTIEVAENGNLSYFTYNRDSYRNILYNSDGTPQKIELAPSAPVASYKPYSESNGIVTSGLYDKRQGQNMNLIEVDVSNLRTLVHDGTATTWGGSEEEDEKDPEEWWNGTVYVQFAQQNASSTRPDGVNPAKSKNWAVKLVNGQTIPNPTFTQRKGIYGTSIATNQSMYVEGHYNSDGNLTTGSATEPDNSDFNGDNQEAPAALVADAITFLSAGWNDANSKQDLSSRVAQSTEVSAAILTGLVPSGETGAKSYSGGVENFPRFLENWKNPAKEFMMRGSIVAMFESEVATEPWGKKDVYKAPMRSWGFHQEYTETPPPGPRVRTYRGRDLQLLTQAEYEGRVRRNW